MKTGMSCDYYNKSASSKAIIGRVIKNSSKILESYNDS